MTRALAILAILAACGDDPPSNPDASTTPDAPPDAGAPAVCNEVWQAPACAATDLVGKLRCIPGMTVTERPGMGLPNHARYDLTYEQPIDHANPALGTFGQRAMLLVTDPARPMVLATSGYNLPGAARLDELASTFRANELWYEHRYFVSSIPPAADWSKLDIRQAAGDAHRFAAALHWLSPRSGSTPAPARAG